jgi:hypothetical protein
MNAEFFEDIIEDLGEDYEGLDDLVDELEWDRRNQCSCRNYCFRCLDMNISDFM